MENIDTILHGFILKPNWKAISNIVPGLKRSITTTLEKTIQRSNKQAIVVI